jgi:hypothetical protein
LDQLQKYRELADRIGGEDGRLIHELIKKYEGRTKGIKLIGNQEVAIMLGIDPRNMIHKRKTEFFPEPMLHAGKFPFWLEDDIEEYIDKIDEWREQRKRVKSD